MSVPEGFDKDEDYNPSAIGTEENLFLIRVPKAFDVSKLDGKRFSKHRITEVGRDDNGPGDLNTVYRSTFYKNEEIGVEPLIRIKNQICLGKQIKGLISVTKSFELRGPVIQQSAQNANTNLVPMPPGLKTRFTPFGAENPIKSSDRNDVRTSHKHKLDDDSLTESPRKSSKKKKKKKEERDSEHPTNKKLISDSEDIDSKPDLDVDMKEEISHIQENGIDLMESTVKSRKKKSKKKKCSTSQDSVEFNLLNASSEGDLTVNSIGSKSRDCGITYLSGNSDLDSSNSVTDISVKKKRKDKLSKCRDLIDDSSFHEQINGFSSKKKKKKEKM